MRDKFSSVKSCTTRYRKYHINIAILISLLFSITLIGSQYLYSQEGVRIKERVEIGSREIARADSLIIKKNEKTMFTSGEVASGFIMPKSGELQIYYVYCNRLDYKLPANASLIVHFLRGDSSKADCIISRFPNVTPWSRLIYNACYGINQYRYQYNYTNTGYSEDVYVYNVGTVTEGDTIQFFYSSNNIVTGDSVLYAIYNADLVAACSWDVVFGDYDWCIGDFNDELNIYVKVESNEILLGETKYYFVRDNSGSAYIDTTTDPDVNPGVQNGSIWSNNPVSIVTCEPNSGRRLGVYWEKKKPDGTDLPSGMIRLIGRYWHEDSVYKVKLKATYGEKEITKDIVVKKPAKLHDPKVFKSPYRTTQNIRGKTVDIDELCIKYGGKIGIPPHVIKGQMFQESDKTDNKFNPSYRYEPWQDYNFVHGKYANSYKKQPFWVTGEGPYPMGKGEAIPLDHQNVKPRYYPINPITIADFVLDNWNLYWDSINYKVINSDDLTKRWWNIYIVTTIVRSLFPAYFQEDPYTYAMRFLHAWITANYRDYAQTRKCASYGLIQMLYTTAVRQGYNLGKTIDSSSAPEKLNDENIEMPLYEVFTLRNLRKQFGGEKAIIPEFNWVNGWENTWIESFKSYNGASGYGISVFNHSKKFYPQAK